MTKPVEDPVELVFALMSGEYHYGGTIISIHRTEEGARAAAAEYMKQPKTWPWDQATYWEWRSGCDFLVIKPQELKP